MVIYGTVMAFFVPKLQKLSKKASIERSIVRGRFVDILSNILTVKLFARRQYEDGYFMGSLKKTADAYVRADLKLWQLWVVLEVWTVTFWIFTFSLTLWGWQQGFVTTAEAAMILPLTIQVTNTSWWMSEIFTSFFQRLGEIQEGMDAIVKAHDVTDDSGASPLQVKQARIDFDGVQFAYEDKPLFQGLDLSIASGEKIGLVGASGAGKSSLVQILLRLYDIQRGAIKIDGQDIAAVTQDSLRANIAVIPQMSDMLHRTIRENILYGRLDATEEEVIDAAKRAHAYDFIQELVDQHGNKGLDALVGERGVKLSGGQRQRIAIARAILKDAPILILDEATSALDSESERSIQESLQDLMRGKTVIAIAHRLSTIAHMDRLIVMENGAIIEQGTHEELSNTEGGRFAKLWKMQSGGFLGKKKA
jgi:ABC-type multidrug transport system fused ATPase/permease subunit